MIYCFQLWHPIRRISENTESQWTLTKTTNVFLFYHNILLDEWKGLTHLILIYSRSFLAHSSRSYRKTGKIIDCQYSVIVSSFFLMNVLSFLCLFSNVMCLFMTLLFWVSSCRPAFSLKLRFKHLLNKESLSFFYNTVFSPTKFTSGLLFDLLDPVFPGHT